ncbi:MAG: NUDIX domain-containing protein [Gammaproteobacteria bacterium]
MECNNRVLLCKRAIKPRLGFWTLPSGYMECNETILEAARRETHEEANILVKKLYLYMMFSCPDINQVYFIFRGNVQSSEPSPCPTEESSESKYFSKENIPWKNLSYSIMDKALNWYFYDSKQGEYRFRMLDVYGCDPDK